MKFINTSEKTADISLKYLNIYLQGVEELSEVAVANVLLYYI